MEYTCDNCDCTIDNSNYLTVSGDHDEAVMVDSNGEVNVVYRLCSDCYNKYNDLYNSMMCDDCGTDKPVCHMNRVDGRSLCNSCVSRNYFYCEHCEERYRRDQDNDGPYRRHDGYLICYSCFEDYYFSCSSCGNIYHGDDSHSTDYDVYCENCYEEEDDSSLIKDYGYKPYNLNFFGTGKLFFGCELEVNVSNNYSLDDKASEVLGLLNGFGDDHVYLKHDSSVGRGFEIVTHPHSYEEIRKLWLEKWSENLRGITSHASGKCGFHVHVSKKAFTPMHIQKLVVFINAPENAALVRTVAQRDCSEWGRIKHDKAIGHCGHSYDRYEAINLMNSQTIEFRIFRGNARKNRILKNIEFVKASIDFTRDRSYRDLSATRFIEFVQQNKKEFKYLHEYLSTTPLYPNPTAQLNDGNE